MKNCSEMKFLSLKDPMDMFFIGVSVGLIGIGLQNYNPLEPRACTHYCSILGGVMIILLVGLVNIIYGAWILYKETRHI